MNKYINGNLNSNFLPAKCAVSSVTQTTMWVFRPMELTVLNLWVFFVVVV